MAEYSDIVYPPMRGEKKFQEFCLTLARKYWKDPFATLHTRSGQADFGVDITGNDTVNALNPVGIQCKGSETNTPRKLTVKILTDTVNAAKKFDPPLKHLIVAYNGPRDGELVREAIKITKSHEQAGLFRVSIWSWDDLLAEAFKLPDVMQWLFTHYEFPIVSDLDPSRPGAATLHVFKFTGVVRDGLPEFYQEAGLTKPSDDPVNDEKINFFRDQISAGHGPTVVEPLRNFIESLGGTPNSKTLFRAYANLGAALVQGGQFDDAVRAFGLARDAVPNTADSHAYAARIAVFENQPDIAFAEAEAALSLDAKHKLAAAIYLDTAPTTVSGRELEDRITELVGEFDVGWALSRAYTDRGEHDEALRVARSIESTPANWARGVAIGDAILHRFEGNVEIKIGAPISKEAAVLIEEAQEELRGVWRKVKTRSDRENWSYVGLNYAVTLMMQGLERDADDLALEVLTYAPTLRPAKQRGALAYLHRGEIDRAVTLANELATSGDAEDLLFAASLETIRNSWSTTKLLAREAFDRATDQTAKARAAELLITAELHIAGPQSAFDTANKLRGEIEPNIAFEGQATEIARRLGDENAVAEGKQRLEEFEAGSLSPMEKFELSEAYADDGQWGKAADLLEGLHPLDRPTELLKRRLFHLYRADRRPEARALFEQLEPHVSTAREILRLGAAIFDRSGLPAKALTILEGALEAGEDLGTRLDWCRFCMRTDNEAKMVEWLQKVDADTTGEPTELLGFSQLLNRYGRRADALRIAYRTLRANWGKEEQLHTMYMSLFLGGVETDVIPDPETVVEDSVVSLTNQHNREARFRLESGVEPQADVLPPQSPLAQALIGARVGETRTAPAGIGQPDNWTVNAIVHKYIDLFQAVMANHTALFPDTTGFGSIHIEPDKDGGLEPIFEQVRARAKRAGDLAKLYRDYPLPIDSIGRMMGLDAIDASLGMRGQQGIRIDTCIGTTPEREGALEQLARTDTLLVDPLTIAIWKEINLLPILAKLDSPKIEIVQATLDNFGDRIEQATASLGRGGGSLEAHGDRIIMIENDDSRMQETKQIWTDVQKWCRDHATIVATETSAELADSDMPQILSRVSVDTLATAAKANRVLLSDDRRIRILGNSIGVTNSAWTQVLLMHLLNANAISHEQYIKLCATLERQKIGFVSIRTRDLIAATSDLETFSQLASALTQPNVEAPSLRAVFCDFAVSIWLNPDMAAKREKLIGIIADRLLVRPDGLILYRDFTSQTFHALRGQRGARSAASLSWSDYVERFVRGHFIWDALAKLSKSNE